MRSPYRLLSKDLMDFIRASLWVKDYSFVAIIFKYLVCIACFTLSSVLNLSTMKHEMTSCLEYLIMCICLFRDHV